MSSPYFVPQDSPESDFTEQTTNFELSDYLSFGDWNEEEPSSVFFGSVQNPVYRANQVVENNQELPNNSKSSR